MPLKIVGAKFSEEEVERIDACAEARGWTRSKFVRVAVARVIGAEEENRDKIKRLVAIRDEHEYKGDFAEQREVDEPTFKKGMNTS